MNFLPNVQLKTYQNSYGHNWNNPQQLAKILIGIPIGDREQFLIHMVFQKRIDSEFW
jgi:hypothetical protein